MISFGADFVETWLSNVDHARGFARMHSFRDGRAGTFFHVEPRQSLTASNADEWLRNAPGTEGAIALAIVKLMLEGGLVADKKFGEAVAAIEPKKVAEASGIPLRRAGADGQGLRRAPSPDWRSAAASPSRAPTPRRRRPPSTS